MSTEHDRYFVEALLSGNTDAWEQMSSCVESWLKHASKLHYISDDDIDDLRQDILTKLIENSYQKLQGFSFRCRLSSWVGSIVNNHLYDHYRSNIRREKRDRGYEEFKRDFTNEGFNVSGLVDNISDSGMIEQAMESLSDIERRTLRQVYWDSLSITEISQITGEKITTVTARLSRARNRLRDILAPETEGKQKAI